LFSADSAFYKWLFDVAREEWSLASGHPPTDYRTVAVLSKNDNRTRLSGYDPRNKLPCRRAMGILIGKTVLPATDGRSQSVNLLEVYLFGGKGLNVATEGMYVLLFLLVGPLTHYDMSSSQNSMWKGRVNAVCFGIEETHPSVCSGHGNCLLDSTCICFNDLKYVGERCQHPICFNTSADSIGEVCGGNGKCVAPNKCECDAMFGEPEIDPSCSSPVCYDTSALTGYPDSKVCGSHGTCEEDGKCTCKVGYNMNEECAPNLLILYWPLWFVAVPSGVILAVCCGLAVIVAMLFLFCKCMGQRKNLSLYAKIDDIDILLTETRADQKGVNIGAHLKIDKQMFNVNINDVAIESILGAGGSNSTVFLATWKGQRVAYKCFKLKDIVGKADPGESQRKYREFEIELNLLASLRHPNIIRFYGAVVTPHRVGFLMEVCSKGDVKDFLTKHRSYAIKERVRMMREIASAMDHLHQRGVLHRDLKCQNVLVTEEESTRLMDFGLSRKVEASNADKTSAIGTSHYMAPEMVLGEDYDSKVDVFSYAIMSFEMLTGDFNPYSSKMGKRGGQYQQFLEFKVANNPFFRPDLERLAIGGLPTTFGHMIGLSWDHDPTKRPTFAEIYKFLTGEGALMDSMVVYIRHAGEEDEDANDCLLPKRTIAELRKLIAQRFPGEQAARMLCAGREVRTDEDVLGLLEDCVIVLEDAEGETQADNYQ